MTWETLSVVASKQQRRQQQQPVHQFAAGSEDEAVMSPSPQRELLSVEEKHNTFHMFYS